MIYINLIILGIFILCIMFVYRTRKFSINKAIKLKEKELNDVENKLFKAHQYILYLITELQSDKKYIKIKPFSGELSLIDYIYISEAVVKKGKYYKITDEYKNKKEEEEISDIYKFYDKKENK